MHSKLMRVITQDEFGGPEVLHVMTCTRPSPGPGKMLVEVAAVGVNPTDFKHRSNERLMGKPPFTLGWDVAGVVVEVGLGVAIHQPGDRVMGMLPYPGRGGAYAEYVLTAPRLFVRMPKNMDFVHAAAMPLASVTAWQALVELAAVRAGSRVLVHGGAGGGSVTWRCKSVRH